MNNNLKVILITLVSFGAYFLLSELYFSTTRTWLNESLGQISISHFLTYLLVGIPIFLGTLVMHKGKIFAESLGLDQSIFRGFLFALLCTAPMFIGFAIVFDFNAGISWNRILIAGVAAGVFEELYFRGFLFGQLFRYTRLGFIASV